MKSTKEVADELGVKTATLQLWVREGHVAPMQNGEGRQKRLAWTDEAIEQARRMRDRGDSDPLVATIGPDLLAAMKLAKEKADFLAPGQVIVATAQVARVFQADASLSDVLRRISGDFFVMLR